MDTTKTETQKQSKVKLSPDAISRLYAACNDILTYDDLDLRGQKNGREFQKIDCIHCGGKGCCFTDPNKKQITCRKCNRTEDYAGYYKYKHGFKSFEMFKAIVPVLFNDEMEAVRYQGAKEDFLNFNTAPKQSTGQEERGPDPATIDPETAKAIKKNQDIFNRFCNGQVKHNQILNLFKLRGIPEEHVRPELGDSIRWKSNHGDPKKPDEQRDVVVIACHSLPGKEHTSQQYFTPDNSYFPGTKTRRKSSPAIGHGFHFAGAPLDAPTTNKLYVTESIMNAFSLLPYVDTSTSCVVSILSSSEARKKAEMLKPWVKDFKVVVSCGDNDKAGNGMDNTIAKVLKDTVAVWGLNWGRDDPDDTNKLQQAGSCDRLRELVKKPMPIKIKDDDPPIKTTKNDEEWEDPQAIEEELLPVDSLPDDAIPTPYKAWVRDISHRWAVPADFPFISTLIVTSAIIGTGAVIKPKKRDDWTVVPNLWGGIIGDPSVMKSPVLNEVINKSMGRLEATARQKLHDDLDEFKADKFIFDETVKAKENDIKKAIKNGGTTDELKSELKDLNRHVMDKPTERRYKVNDCTIEKYVELNKENPRGLLYFRDELIGFFKRLDKEGNEADRALCMEAWNGQGNYTQDRIGRGSIRAKNLCMSLIGGIQPDKIIGYLNDAMNGGNDGFVQRLQMMVYPDRKKWEFIDQYPDTDAKNTFYTVIEVLAEMRDSDFIEAGADMPDDEDFPHFKFDEPSYQLFKAWMSDLQQKIENVDEHQIIREHLSKYKSLMPSLALIYHLIEVASGVSGSESIPEHCTKQAIACVKYLESHARRIYGMAIDSSSTGAVALSQKILAGKVKSPFTARDIYISGWSKLNNSDDAQKAIDYLDGKNWIKETEQRNPLKGGRPKTEYIINPKVFDIQKAQ